MLKPRDQHAGHRAQLDVDDVVLEAATVREPGEVTAQHAETVGLGAGGIAMLRRRNSAATTSFGWVSPLRGR